MSDYIYTVRLGAGGPVETWHGPGCVAVTGYASADFAADPDLWIRMVDEADRNAVCACVRRLQAVTMPRLSSTGSCQGWGQAMGAEHAGPAPGSRGAGPVL